MSSIFIIGNGNKSSVTDFPECSVYKTWFGVWKWKAKIGNSTCKGTMSDLTNSFIQQANGLTVSGSPSKYATNTYLICFTYTGWTGSKIFTIKNNKLEQ